VLVPLGGLPFEQKFGGNLEVSIVNGFALIQNTDSPLVAVIVVSELPFGSCNAVTLFVPQDTYAVIALAAG
jgi:hypothetical protein